MNNLNLMIVHFQLVRTLNDFFYGNSIVMSLCSSPNCDYHYFFIIFSISTDFFGSFL